MRRTAPHTRIAFSDQTWASCQPSFAIRRSGQKWSVPMIKKILKIGSSGGPTSAIALALAGTVARRVLKNTAQQRLAGGHNSLSGIEEVAHRAKEEAKQWLRDNHAPERLRDLAEHLLAADRRYSPNVVDARAKPTPPND